jgi:hypothetical protein
MFRRVTERIANFIQCGGHTVIEVHEGFGLPQGATHLIARYDFSGLLDQQRQQLERLRLQPDFAPIFAQFSGAQV